MFFSRNGMTIRVSFVCVAASRCSYNPCKNDGTCFKVGRTYGCVCRRPFRGTNCEYS